MLALLLGVGVGLGAPRDEGGLGVVDMGDWRGECGINVKLFIQI